MPLIIHFHREGSIWATLEMQFQGGASDEFLLQPLKDAISGGKLGPFTVNKTLDLNPSMLTLNFCNLLRHVHDWKNS